MSVVVSIISDYSVLYLKKNIHKCNMQSWNSGDMCGIDGGAFTGLRFRLWTTPASPFSAAAEGAFSGDGVAAARRIGITEDLPDEQEGGKVIC